jgi:protein-tyrosine-phosphatase
MAEAFARQLGAGVVEASSAGLYQAPIIQPETLQVLAECGIEPGIAMALGPPRSLLQVDPAGVDLIVNMSGVPLDPLLNSFTGQQIVWQVRDPIGQSIEVYRSARNQIEKKVTELLEQLRQE